jgi:hypothetical protein
MPPFKSTFLQALYGGPEFDTQSYGSKILALQLKRKIIFPPPENHGRHGIPDTHDCILMVQSQYVQQDVYTLSNEKLHILSIHKGFMHYLLRNYLRLIMMKYEVQ